MAGASCATVLGLAAVLGSGGGGVPAHSPGGVGWDVGASLSGTPDSDQLAAEDEPTRDDT